MNVLDKAKVRAYTGGWGQSTIQISRALLACETTLVAIDNAVSDVSFEVTVRRLVKSALAELRRPVE